MKALIALLLSIFLTFPAIAFSHAASLSPGPDAQQRINDSASGKDPVSLQAISGPPVSLPFRGLGLLQSIDGLMSSGRIASAGRKNFPEALAPSLPPLSAQPSFGSNSVTQESVIFSIIISVPMPWHCSVRLISATPIHLATCAERLFSRAGGSMMPLPNSPACPTRPHFSKPPASTT